MTSPDGLLPELCKWFEEQCDGKWEHGSGIALSTLDNPGWRFAVNLRGLVAERLPFQEINIEKDEHDWLRCFVEDRKFVGAGDPSKLPDIIGHFLDFVQQTGR